MYNHSPMGKMPLKRLPMGMANSPGIFKQKMNDLFHVLKFIHAYIDKKNILTKGDWTDHVQIR